ncbi:MAG: metallophosphoesterase [Lachnospiraceae bacterium]|nr:metallophosphoesterase [Lachnospiraceae bacterium]
MKTILIVLLIIFILFCIAVIIFDSNRYVIREYAVKTDKVSCDRTIVFLSDLHNKKYGKNNEKLLSDISALNPDLVLVGGDMMTAYPGEDYSVGLKFVSEVCKNRPYVYAEGNHEYRARIYTEDYNDLSERYNSDLSANGVAITINDHEDFFDEIRVFSLSIGHEYYRRFKLKPMSDDYIASLVGEPDESRFNILLAHNPDYFKNYVKWGADMTLSGHVHGGVVRIPFWIGVISPMCTLFPKYSGGMYKKNDQAMIVSRGMGMHTIPLRMFNPAEIVVIRICQKDK